VRALRRATVISLGRSRDLPAEARCDIPAAVGRAAQPPILPCTGLGFSCRPPRGETRWALTPPFHPYRAVARPAVYSLWHCPSPRDVARSAPAWAEAYPCGDLATGRHSATTFLAGNPARWCPDFPLEVATGAALPAPWDQRTRSDDLAPKPRSATLPKLKSLCKPAI